MQAAFRATAQSSLAPTRPVTRAFCPVVAKASTGKASTQARHKRLRKKLSGTPERPRLAVYRSNEHIYAQVIDDVAGHTLVSASTLHKELKGSLESTANVAAAEAVGKAIAEACKTKNIETVCFDRGGFKYHGRVKAVAEAARAAGLNF